MTAKFEDSEGKSEEEKGEASKNSSPLLNNKVEDEFSEERIMRIPQCEIKKSQSLYQRRKINMNLTLDKNKQNNGLTLNKLSVPQDEVEHL